MKIHSVIPIEKRKNYRCHFCGTTRSVKYVTEIFDPVIDSKPTKVCCCNKCILLASEIKYPCIDCVYFDACGDLERTIPCDGRETERKE